MLDLSSDRCVNKLRDNETIFMIKEQKGVSYWAEIKNVTSAFGANL